MHVCCAPFTLLDASCPVTHMSGFRAPIRRVPGDRPGPERQQRTSAAGMMRRARRTPRSEGQRLGRTTSWSPEADLEGGMGILSHSKICELLCFRLQCCRRGPDGGRFCCTWRGNAKHLVHIQQAARLRWCTLAKLGTALEHQVGSEEGRDRVLCEYSRHGWGSTLRLCKGFHAVQEAPQALGGLHHLHRLMQLRLLSCSAVLQSLSDDAAEVMCTLLQVSLFLLQNRTPLAVPTPLYYYEMRWGPQRRSPESRTCCKAPLELSAASEVAASSDNCEETAEPRIRDGI